MFYHLTYEGAVDIEQITDILQRESLEAQINEFGQTPKQLFDVPHPQKVPKVSVKIIDGNALLFTSLLLQYMRQNVTTPPLNGILLFVFCFSLQIFRMANNTLIMIESPVPNFNSLSIKTSPEVNYTTSTSPSPILLTSPISPAFNHTDSNNNNDFVPITNFDDSYSHSSHSSSTPAMTTWGNVRGIELDFNIKIHREYVHLFYFTFCCLIL